MAKRVLQECLACGHTWYARGKRRLLNECPACGSDDVEVAEGKYAGGGRPGCGGCTLIVFVIVMGAAALAVNVYFGTMPNPIKWVRGPGTPAPTGNGPTDTAAEDRSDAVADGESPDGSPPDARPGPNGQRGPRPRARPQPRPARALADVYDDLAEAHASLLEARGKGWHESAAPGEPRMEWVLLADQVRQRATQVQEQIAAHAQAPAAPALEAARQNLLAMVEALTAGEPAQYQSSERAYKTAMTEARERVLAMRSGQPDGQAADDKAQQPTPPSANGEALPPPPTVEESLDARYREWLALARNYHLAGRDDLALEYIERIVASGDAEWSAKAAELFEQIQAKAEEAPAAPQEALP